MSEEEKKAIEIVSEEYQRCIGCRYVELHSDDLKIILDIIEKQNEKIEQLKKQNEDLYEDNIVYHNIMMKQNRREFRSKFLKEFQEEYGTSSYPDYDEIYKRYYNLKNNSIPKSVIMEKIEECKENAHKFYQKKGINTGCKFCNNACNWYSRCKLLKELLGEE